jgi:hypothetical protein
VDVSELEVSALVVKGYLAEEDRNDAQAIKAAVEGVISDIAFDLQQGTSMGSGSPLWEGLGEARSARQTIRLQRVTILRKVFRDLKPTLIVDAPR